MTRALMGYGLVAAGATLALWTNSVLGWRRLVGLTSEPPDAALPRLVFAGPYRLVRHPLLLALLLALGGAAVVGGQPWLWVSCAAAVVSLPWLAVREERRLIARFGEAYRRYQHAVPMIIPRLRRPY